MAETQQFFGANQLYWIQQVLQEPDAVAVLNATVDLYGRQRQLLHAVEELNELSCALLQGLKRGFAADQMHSIAEETCDVIIQTAILLNNFPIFEDVLRMIPEKIAKAKVNIKRELEKQKEAKNG